MTEPEWLECDDAPTPMVKWLYESGKTTQRKVRLSVCACGRLVWHLLKEEDRHIIRIAEEFDEFSEDLRLLKKQFATFWIHDNGPQSLKVNPASEADVSTGFDFWIVIGNMSATLFPAAYFAAENDPVFLEEAARTKVSWPNRNPRWMEGPARSRYEAILGEMVQCKKKSQVAIVRDIFGNPFRTVALDPAWLTPRARTLAQAVYDNHAFDNLHILADALEQAGCTHADVLAHCRGPGPHVRGCWIVDLILGKK